MAFDEMMIIRLDELRHLLGTPVEGRRASGLERTARRQVYEQRNHSVDGVQTRRVDVHPRNRLEQPLCVWVTGLGEQFFHIRLYI